MIKKNVIKAIIALIIVGGSIGLLITIKSFANNEFEESANSKHKIEENNDKEVLEDNSNTNEEENVEVNEKLSVVMPENNNNNNINEEKVITVTLNLNEEKENNYYKALAALEIAENIIDEVSYNEAYDLANKVEDETKYLELKNRLEILKNEIEVKNIVNNLKNKVVFANSIEEIDSAREYSTEQNINQRIQNLTNTLLKNQLNELINPINRILLDVETAQVNVEDNEITKSKKITINDYNTFTAVLINLETNETIKINTGYEIDQEGKYELIVVDESFNLLTKFFEIDKTAPTFNIDNNTYYNSENINLEVIDNNPDLLLITHDGIEKKYEENIFDQEGEYEIKAIDKAGNVSETIRIIIDNTDPLITINGIKEDDIFLDEVEYIITDDNVASIIIDGEEVEDILQVTGNISELGRHSIKVIDQAGNESIKDFEIRESSNI